MLCYVRVDVIVASAELTTNARSTVTIVNDTTGLSCCTNTSLSIHWHYTSTDNTMYVVYNGHSVHPDLLESFHVSFNSTTSCSHLTINVVQLGDAGTYSCLESDTGRRQLHFHLVVFGQHVNIVLILKPTLTFHHLMSYTHINSTEFLEFGYHLFMPVCIIFRFMFQ